MNYYIHPIPALKDNYIWLLVNQDNQNTLVVDPGEADPVIDYLHAHLLNLSAIIVTHHHGDHTNGVAELYNRYQVPVYASIDNHHPAVTHRLHDADTLALPALGFTFQAIAVPGHTLDHMAFYAKSNESNAITLPESVFPQAVPPPQQGAIPKFEQTDSVSINPQAPFVFTGDTLFSAGCGRIFEGTPAQMYASLQRLLALPNDTAIYCGHEYTLSNLAFAREVEPNNQAILSYQQRVAHLREQGLVSLPSTLTLEKQINPFLRATHVDVIQAASVYAGQTFDEPWQVFAALREWKNAL